MKLVGNLLSCVLLILGLVSSAEAVTFNLDKPSNRSDLSWDTDEFPFTPNGYEWLTYEKGDLSLTVTAWRGNTSSSGGPWVYDDIINDGLGVKNGPDDNSVAIEYSGNSRWSEGLLFTFDQSVELTGMGFRYVDGDDEMEILNMDGSTMNSFGVYDLKKSIGFDTPLTGTSFLVTATDWNDDFFIKSIKANPRSQAPGPVVPVPSTVLLLGAGLVGFVGFRKQTAV